MKNKKQYWFCYIGPEDPNKMDINGADSPFRTAVKNVFEAWFPKNKKYILGSGWGVSEDNVNHISFATYDEDLKKSVIFSYNHEKKEMPRHVKAWELLLKYEEELENRKK